MARVMGCVIHTVYEYFHFILLQMSHFSACDEGPGVCSRLLTVFSLFLIIVSLPLSLFVVVKVVQVIVIPILILIVTIIFIVFCGIWSV